MIHYDILWWCLLHQWTEAGDRGATGVSVMRPVEEVTKPGLVNACSLNTVVSRALDRRWNTKSVTSSRAPVSIQYIVVQCSTLVYQH